MPLPGQILRPTLLVCFDHYSVRLHRLTSKCALSLVVALCSASSVIGWFNSSSLGWRYLVNRPPTVGMFGAGPRDIRRETPAETQARLRLDREILTELTWSTRVSQWSATSSLLGAIYLVWRTRRVPVPEPRP